MNKVFKYILVGVAVISVSKVIGKVMGVGDKPDTRATLTKLVTDLNTQLPKDIDSTTRATRVELIGNTVRYNYSLIPVVDINAEQKSAFESAAIKQVCNGDMKVFSKEGITMEFMYSYVSSSGGKDMLISVPPHKCT